MYESSEGKRVLQNNIKLCEAETKFSRVVAMRSPLVLYFQRNTRKMKTSIPGKLVGCIGKCTSGLTAEELDHVTDNIHKTLTHSRGRQIFKEYLKQERRHDDLECLKFWEKCSEYIEKEQDY